MPTPVELLLAPMLALIDLRPKLPETEVPVKNPSRSGEARRDAGAGRAIVELRIEVSVIVKIEPASYAAKRRGPSIGPSDIVSLRHDSSLLLRATFRWRLAQ
jgi:hypothetical protein